MRPWGMGGDLRRVMSVVGLCGALFLLGCSEAPSGEEALQEVRDLVDVLGLEVSNDPNVVRSKSVEYAAGAGSLKGDQGSVVAQVQVSLEGAGWHVESVHNPDSDSRSSTEATIVRARRDEMVASVGVYDKVGNNAASPGERRVQVAVAHEDSGVGWAQEPEVP